MQLSLHDLSRVRTYLDSDDGDNGPTATAVHTYIVLEVLLPPSLYWC